MKFPPRPKRCHLSHNDPASISTVSRLSSLTSFCLRARTCQVGNVSGWPKTRWCGIRREKEDILRHYPCQGIQAVIAAISISPPLPFPLSGVSTHRRERPECLPARERPDVPGVCRGDTIPCSGYCPIASPAVTIYIIHKLM